MSVTDLSSPTCLCFCSTGSFLTPKRGWAARRGRRGIFLGCSGWKIFKVKLFFLKYNFCK